MHSKNLNDEKPGWRPVLTYKKLYSEPKFILSLERRKARIITGLRDRQVEEGQKKLLGLVGGKVKKPNYFKSLYLKEFLTSNLNAQQFVQANENSLRKNQLKPKKNPYMNFSLMYISGRKKEYGSETNSKKTRVSSAYHSNSQREKGSDQAYLHMMVSQPALKKEYNRPKTSCLSDRNRVKQRPRSQIS